MDSPERQESQQLPFDPRTQVVSLLRQWWIVLVGVLAGAVLGVVAALTLGSREYVSETSLLFTGKADELVGGVYRTPSLRTYLNMVKLAENIEETREVLKLPVTLQQLGSAFTATAQNETSLLFIRASADDAEASARLANTLRDVFLENSVAARNAEVGRALATMEARLQEVTEELGLADKALEEFSKANQVVDLDKEAQWFLEQFIATDSLYDQSKIEETTITMQLESLDKIMENLKTQIQQETESSADVEGLGWAKIRADRIREKIHTDESRRANEAKLVELELLLMRAKTGVAQGIMPQAELDRAQAAYDAQRAVTVDTGQVSEWKEELERLDESIVPEKGKTESPSAPILREMLTKSFDLQLQKSSIEYKVKQLDDARRRIRETLDAMPAKQKQHVDLKRAVMQKAADKQDLEGKLAAARELLSRSAPDFSILSPAEPPLYPVKSTRKILAAAGFVLCAGLSAALALARVALNFSILSSAECELRTGLPVLLETPLETGEGGLFNESGLSVHHEGYRTLLLAVRQRCPDPGLRVLVSSPRADCGVSTVVSGLAVAAARADNRVLAVDAHVGAAGAGEVRGIGHGLPLADHCEERASGNPGLGGYLSFTVDKPEEVMLDTSQPGAWVVPPGEAAAPADYIGSARMREFLEDASGRFSLVLVDAPPLEGSSDAVVLAGFCGAVLLVARAGRTTYGELKRAAERLRVVEKPPVGVVLTGVSKWYQRR